MWLIFCQIKIQTLPQIILHKTLWQNIKFIGKSVTMIDEITDFRIENDESGGLEFKQLDFNSFMTNQISCQAQKALQGFNQT